MTKTIAPWPPDQLEAIRECPICGHGERELVHAGLTDVTFFIAKGSWDMWRCHQCGSGYLDPRPDEASIGYAYGTYYTHEVAEMPSSGNGWRARLGNGYRNWRFGTSARPTCLFGPLAALLRPSLRAMYEQFYRYLPNPPRGSRRHLLDFGCGDGSFLRLAQAAGWTCRGVELDPVARAIATRNGADVRSSLQDFRDEQFDAVTLCHVIEHVHDPVGLLRSIAGRMRSGAHLYIDTPNMLATGHRLYGRHWRGLEAPRHLSLMTRTSLTETLATAGFGQVEYRDCPGALEFTQIQSRRIAAGSDPYDPLGELSGVSPGPSDYAQARYGEHAEFLRLTAIRA